jgi:UDP-2,4-diacetamido-2,4,6-trideoxy-beta-L-altropyranose hydrolase
MKRLLFRADGNAQIGLGHVMRCLALIDMLKGEFLIRFAIVEPTPDVRSLIEKTDAEVISLPASSSLSSFLEVIEPQDIVVLDGYSFDESFQQTVRSRAKRLVYIDDLAAGHQVADVVINHAGGIAPNDYEAESYTQFFLGPHYALLRPEFLRPEGFDEVPQAGPIQAGPIFVSLGGADPQNISLTVLEAIRQVDASLPVHIVLGPFHPNRPSIDAFRTQLPRLTILQNLSAGQMAQELYQSSLAITACSTISYEVCAVNRPLIAVVTADNQARLAQFLSEEKLALSVNFPTLLTRLTPVLGLDQLVKLSIQSFQFSPDTVTESLANQRRFFDGRSPERFRDLFDQLTR